MNPLQGRPDPSPSNQRLEPQRRPTQLTPSLFSRSAASSTIDPNQRENGVGMRELRVEDALLYLDQVKQQFGDHPAIYNQFLDVMKNFKSQTIDTPGVIRRVSTLFRGYPNLILGFNTFLPPGFKIKQDHELGILTTGSGQTLCSSNAPAEPQAPPPPQPPPPQPPQQQPAPSTQAPSPPVDAPSTSPIGAARATGQPVEFDQAIHYVTTIKRRFSDEPDTYKAFLEILHTYQKEQRSIKQVLEQVSHLFRDHPDLLREFTYFLPDAAQEQAKERLNRAAEKAMQRKAIRAKLEKDKVEKEQKKEIMRQKAMEWEEMEEERRRVNDRALEAVRERRKEVQKELDKQLERAKNIQEREKERERLRRSKAERDAERKERERERQRLRYAEKKAKKRPYDEKERRDRHAYEEATVLPAEWTFFERVKKVLPSRDCYRELLKCLDLYSQEVIGRQEMLALVTDLFGRHTDLLAEFKKMLHDRGAGDDIGSDVWFTMPLAEIDFSQCRRCTPSYRALPPSYPNPSCSERSELEKSVCNDAWVSVPTGSEDFSFKNMRKNQYEEALFKCEDERFEIDMVIDANASTIRILEPLAREIEALKEAAESGELHQWQYKLDKRTLGTVHLNAIARIYGDNGNEVLEMLRKHPAGAIPVILKRLQQKDEEWRRARVDLNKQWKEIMDKNFHKSLDHCSFYFKQQDKKQISTKSLIAEIKAKAESSSSRVVATMETEEIPWEPHFTFNFPIPTVHRDVYAVLLYAAEHSLSTGDKERVAKLWKEFISVFFMLPEDWLNAQTHTKSPVSASSLKGESISGGTSVMTSYGPGTIKHFDQDNGKYVVSLPYGEGILQAKDVHIPEKDEFPPNIAYSDDEKLKTMPPQNAPITSGNTLLYSNQHAYVFFRLYQMLYFRLQRARELCDKAKRNRSRITVNPAARAFANAHEPEDDVKDKTGDYQTFLTTLYALLDNSVDNTRYEDSCRELMGTSSFLLFTLDKLVSHILKVLHSLVSDETCVDLQDLFFELRKDHQPIIPSDYLNKARPIFEGETAYRLQYHRGILRKTPLENPEIAPVEQNGAAKIWAPSPRVQQKRPSPWLTQPSISIDYLGSIDEAEHTETPGGSPTCETPTSDSPDEKKIDGDKMDIDGKEQLDDVDGNNGDGGNHSQRKTRSSSATTEDLDSHNNEHMADENGTPDASSPVHDDDHESVAKSSVDPSGKGVTSKEVSSHDEDDSHTRKHSDSDSKPDTDGRSAIRGTKRRASESGGTESRGTKKVKDLNDGSSANEAPEDSSGGIGSVEESDEK